MSAATVTPDMRITKAQDGFAWLILPALLFLAAIYLYPMCDMLLRSIDGATWSEHYHRIFTTPLYYESLLRSLGISVWVVAICVLVGYPVALFIHRSEGIIKLLMLIAIILPYFVAILVRTYSWAVALGRNGPLNNLLRALGITSQPLELLFNRWTVIAGISAVLLPMMVLTIYSSLNRIQAVLYRAAAVTGANSLVRFWLVGLPLTIPSVGAGVLLVFVASLGFFITPTMLGGAGDQMFAMHITQQTDFITSRGFPQALGSVLLIVTLALVGGAGRFVGLEAIWGGQSQRKRVAREERYLSSLNQKVTWPIIRQLNRLPEWIGPVYTSIVGAAVFVIMLAPIIIVVILSFGNSRYLQFPPPSYSMRWYEIFWSNPDWTTAFGNSLLVASISVVISLIIGTCAALGIVRSRLRGKTALMLLFISPIVVPGVVMGLSMYAMFLRLGLVGNPLGLAAAHALGGLPIVIIIISASLQGTGRTLEYAAAIHGAGPLRVFWRITLPAILPAMLAAGFFAFLHSFDELVVTLFLSSPSLPTLPMRLWADVNYQLSPVLAVVSTLEVVVICVGLLVGRKGLTARLAS